jgi:hypothetical protein
MLDALKNIYWELQLVFINEASIVEGASLFSIENRIISTKHIQTKYFGNTYMVFYDDIYQEQPIHDSLIFEHPTMNVGPKFCT